MRDHLDAIREQLDEIGEQRRQGLLAAESALRSIVDLLPEAADDGLAARDVAAITGVGRVALEAAVRSSEREQDLVVVSSLVQVEVDRNRSDETLDRVEAGEAL